MEEYLSEKEQIERIRQWWSENGRFVISGLVLGISAIYGWRAWVDHRENHLADASTYYNQLLAAAEQGNRDLALQLSGRLESDFADTAYALQADLLLARLHMDAGESELAAERLNKVLNSTRDAELKHIVRLRLARVLLDQQRAQQALDLLGIQETGEFSPLYHDLRGDVLLAMGRNDGARDAYLLALEELEPARPERGYIEMKLNDLGVPAADVNATTQAENGS